MKNKKITIVERFFADCWEFYGAYDGSPSDVLRSVCLTVMSDYKDNEWSLEEVEMPTDFAKYTYDGWFYPTNQRNDMMEWGTPFDFRACEVNLQEVKPKLIHPKFITT